MHRLIVSAILCGVAALAQPVASFAQAPEPSLPPGPVTPPGPLPNPLGGIATENFLATSAANEHGSYLWVVAPIQHVVILCEKLEQTKEFTCTTKRLP